MKAIFTLLDYFHKRCTMSKNVTTYQHETQAPHQIIGICLKTSTEAARNKLNQRAVSRARGTIITNYQLNCVPFVIIPRSEKSGCDTSRRVCRLHLVIPLLCIFHLNSSLLHIIRTWAIIQHAKCDYRVNLRNAATYKNIIQC